KVPHREKYFTQNLDHFNFNPQSYKTFQQRYLINDTYWRGKKDESPIFVFLGHGDGIKDVAADAGLLYDIAPTFNALIVYIEHRYFGKSIPFGSLKHAYKNASTLGYLSASQALADTAVLIRSLKANLSTTGSPVVVFGGSYGGILATWFRLKYPHVALGALASSAPVLLFDNLVSPYKITDIVTQDYKSVSKSCYSTIKNSWEEIKKTGRRKGGRDQLTKKLRICKNKMSTEIIVEKVFGLLETMLLFSAISDYPVSTSIHASLPAHPVKKICNAIDHPKLGKDTLSRLYGAMNLFYNSTGQEKCLSIKSDSQNGSATYGWDFQGCTELIQPPVRNSIDSLFLVRISTKPLIGDAQSSRIKPRPNWITTEFGGQDFKKVLKKFGSNIIFSNGLRDPLSAGSIVKSISKSIVAVTMEEGAHNGDLFFATKEDPEWLQNARKREMKIIKRWLEQ
ncbi:LOW QUALITY PROTEIN: lysosomal Pro-X carboxypeptidase-like, partial [Asparagus officinalis]|uniref:LOW QUALITY PROTEIN: lysosomal Pro-X carboxypeptidase-like n=1 Tax=Asparagus officinalis TaxID=4686 RepID=UPI00098E548E